LVREQQRWRCRCSLEFDFNFNFNFNFNFKLQLHLSQESGGMILVNRPGTYDVVYNCRAVDDTPALSATRTVWVSEYFAPGCDQVTVTASHGAGPSLAGGVGAAGASVDVRYPPPHTLLG
jgi:hypothetical protein